MPDSPFKLLFSPIKVGKLTLRNRIVFLPHGINFPVEGLPGDREMYYFEERAKGGVGLIIHGVQVVHSSGGAPFVNAGDPRVVEQYKRITDAVHQNGSYIFAQLLHWGTQHDMNEIGLGWRMPYGSSARPYERTITRQMTHDDIKRAIEAYVVAARHARQGGYDGIEVRMNNALVLEFVSALFNKRTDEYGGPLENRLRFAKEVINAVHSEVGRDMVMDARICVDEVVPEGSGVEVGQEIARSIEATGKIAFINTSIGVADGQGSVAGVYAAHPYPFPEGHGVYAAEALKKAVNIPVVAQGRINNAELAERVLAEGKGDLIGMVRGLIADPEFPNKAREGRAEDIRRCFSYNDICQRRPRRPVSCIWNPAAGREQELGLGTLKPAAVKKKVVIIGGGPAGMKLADVAARRGHQVSLYEKSNQLGGQINLAIRLPYREHLAEIPTYYTRQLEKLGVEVKKGVEVTPEMVRGMPADAVVVATGSVPYIPSIPGANQNNVVNYWDVARDREVKGNTILIFDRLGDGASTSIAELLVDQGKKVYLVTGAPAVGSGLQFLTLAMWKQRMDGKSNLIRTTEATVKAISGTTVTLSSTASMGRDWTVDGIDTVVLANGGFPNDGLYHALQGKVKDLRMVGDCEAPLPIERAIHSAELLGREL